MYSSLLTVVCLTVAVSQIAAMYPMDNRHLLKVLSGHEMKQKSRIHHMSVSEADDNMQKLQAALLLHGVPIATQDLGSLVGAPFHWESCGAADQLVNIKNLTFAPSPLSFPGPLSFGFDIEFRDTIHEDAVVSADVKLEVNARGTWIEIPCIGGIGSCNYASLCPLMKTNVHCPPEILKQGIPCSCPFNKGEYKLQKYSVDVDAAVIPSGDYRAQVTLAQASNAQIACYKLSFTVA